MMDQPTRERMRRDLAVAMGYTVEVRWTHATNPNWKIYDVRLPGGTYAGSHSASEAEAWEILADPFSDHTACHALVCWLDADDARWERFERIFLDRFADEPNIVRECLLVETAVVAEAAWGAIQIRQ